MLTELKALAADKTTATVESSKKQWIEPEITWHKQLEAITLGVQCQATWPPCTQSPLGLNV